MRVYNIPQRTEEWYKLRAGKITGSAVENILVPSKRNLQINKLVAERLKGRCTEIPITEPMQRGIDLEEGARHWYEEFTGNKVTEVGFCVHDKYPFLGCSPDGLIQGGGLLEIKCRSDHNHINALLGKIPLSAERQMLQQCLVTGEPWVDYFEYDPDLPSKYQGIITRFYPDAHKMNAMLDATIKANEEVEKRLEKINQNLDKMYIKWGH